MTPNEFKGQNIIFGANQPEYNPLDNKSVVTITLQEFAEKYLDRLYNPNCPDTMQCGGWYDLKNMVEKQITPNEHNTQGFHPLLRDILIKNWNRIKVLPTPADKTDTPMPVPHL